jgi:beta-lactamase regulating signal transducer with metallopeptidase domain
MHTIATLFDWFLSATIRGSLLALAVIFIQIACGRRLPASWRFALWLPVVWVLGVPVLPESKWSFENRFHSIAVFAEAIPEANSTESFAGSSVPAFAPSKSVTFDWKILVAVLWLVGSGSVLLLGVIAYLRELRRLRSGRIEHSSDLDAALVTAALTCGLRGLPRVLLSRGVSSPAITGLLRPLLLLPANFVSSFDSKERHFILLHELIHVKRGDLIMNWILFVLQAIHWCNPVVWVAFARMRADRERACDSAVLASSSDHDRSVYGHALLKLGGTGIPGMLSLAFVGLFGNGRVLRSRIEAIADFRISHPVWSVVGMILLLGLSLAGATRAQSDVPASDPVVRQILIEAKFIEVPADLKFEINSENATYDQRKGFLLFLQSPADAAALVDVLTKSESTDMLSTPSIVTTSGRKAQVEIGSDPEDPAGETNHPRILLEVVPELVEDGIRLAFTAVSTRGPVMEEGGAKNSSEVRLRSDVTMPSGQSIVLVESRSEGQTQPGRRLIVILKARVEGKAEALQDKLDRILIPQIEFANTSLPEALAHLRELARAHDPEKKAVQILLSPEVADAKVHLTLSLKDLPLSSALKYTANLAGMELEFGEFAVTLRKAEELPGASHPSPENVTVSVNEYETRLSRIVIPVIEFREAYLGEALQFLQAQSVEQDPAKQGVNLILKADVNQAASNPQISLVLKNVPLSEALRYLAELAGMKLRYEQDAVMFIRP